MELIRQMDQCERETWSFLNRGYTRSWLIMKKMREREREKLIKEISSLLTLLHPGD